MINNKENKTSQKLTVEQLEQAITILKQEQQRNKLSRFQKISSQILIVSVIGYVIFIFGCVICALFDALIGPSSLLIYTIFSIVFVFWGGFIILLFFINFPAIILKAWRQRKLVSRLKLKGLLDVKTKVYSKRDSSLYKVTRIIAFFGLFILGLGIITSISDALSYRLSAFHYYFTLSGLVMMCTHSIFRLKLQLDFLTDLDHLQNSFFKYKLDAEQTDTDLVEVPTAYLQRIAKIEKNQIAQQHAEAIAQFRKETQIPELSVGDIKRLEIKPFMMIGGRGSKVEWIQQRLRVHGFDILVDGIFGPKTDSAVRHFQKRKNLVADGVVGPKTFEELKQSTYTYSKSKTVQKKSRELKPDQRAFLLDKIEELMVEPRPKGSKKDIPSGMWSLRIPKSPLRIFYTINDKERQINFIEIANKSDSDTPNKDSQSRSKK